jgi:cyclic-di-AMP phosphodiesterase PgpH
MATVAKLVRRERPAGRWFLDALQNIRSGLTWRDAAVGIMSGLAICSILLAFRDPAVPAFKVGTAAAEDVRAFEDFTCQDSEATTRKRNEARASVPAVYDLRHDLILERETALARMFEAGRQALRTVAQAQRLTIAREVAGQLSGQLGGQVPSVVLEVLARLRFSPEIESQVLRTLDPILRNGIVADRVRFMQDQRAGVAVRDGMSPVERSLAAGYSARDLASAKEHLRQYSPELAGFNARDREVIVGFLETQLFPTLLSADSETTARREAAAARVAPIEIRVRRGTLIVRAGDIVTPEIEAQLTALRRLQSLRPSLRRFSGVLFFVLVLLFTLWRHFVHQNHKQARIRSHALLVIIAVSLSILVMRALAATAELLSERSTLEALRDPTTLYRMIPFATGAVLVALLIDVYVGILASVIISLFAGFFFGDVWMAAYALTGSLAGIYSVRHYHDRAAVLKAGLTVGGACVLASTSLDLMSAGAFSPALLPARAASGLACGLLTAAIVSMLLPVFEWAFKITTDVRLLELSNLNAPILRRLAVEAPGTYHHSLMVGSLGEAAAEAIGASATLVRVGAYFHDIGKVQKPEYFVENQAFGLNKHEALSPNMSALIIASHVKDGLELAAAAGLPQVIRDMIPQHHGTRVMSYFYQKAKDAGDPRNGDVAEESFRYPGPRPQSREAAIIMLADAVEAASHTLTSPMAGRVQAMIDRIVDAIVADHQLDECHMTFREVTQVKESFLKILTGIHHRRISYPGYEFNEPAQTPDDDTPSRPGVKQTAPF